MKATKLIKDYNLPDKLQQRLEEAIDGGRLNEDVYVEAIQDAWPDYEQEVKQISLMQREKNSVPVEDFFEGTDHGSKTEMAHRYAEYQVQEKNTLPVVIENATLFFRYNEDSKTWQQIDLSMLHKELDRELSQPPVNLTVTRHVHNEFDSKMTNYGEFVDFDSFGLKPTELLLKNGEIIDLENPIGEIDKSSRPAERSDYALNSVNAELDPYVDDIHDSKLSDFICDTIPDDDERRALQQFLGFCLMWPSDDFEKALLILGPTDSGKSTLLKVFKHFFNDSNTTNVSFPQLGQERAFHVDKLKQSVLNFDHDMADKGIQRKSRVKKIISKETVFCDPKNDKGYTIKPVANFMIASNHPPDIHGEDEAFVNRFLTIEAPNRISDEEKDRELLDKLTTEREMQWLLWWAIDGYEDLKTTNQFCIERNIRETREMWARFGDSVHRFISEKVDRNTENSKNVPTNQLFEAYENWCEDNFEDAEGKRTFKVRAQEHPVITKKKAVPYDGMNQRQCFVDIEVDAPL